jgi:hypothetical protein
MYSNKKDSMTVPISVHMWHKKTETKVLLDSGATHNFIDKRAVNSLGLGTRSLPHPLQVNNVDGSLNQEGSITQYCNLWIRQKDRVEKLGFYVANLGSDRIIFGHPWFRTFNPSIDWSTNCLKGDNFNIETAGYRSKTKPLVRVTTPSESSDQKETQESIPPQYHRHWRVFSEEAAQRFPPSRLDDHAIELKPGAPAKLDCKLYRQTEKELEALKVYIDENLAKGYIVETNSPYASPVFFRAKKDGKLRPIVDYRALNAWTVRDVYPLPLIGGIIDQLQGKKIFTKADLRWGFNNIRIKEEDQWKAAFKTPYGLFKPRVLPFGMNNAPSTFCRAMSRLLWPLLNKYPTELFVYMDDILIATGDDVERHRQIVHEVLDLLEEESYFLRPAKCEFEQRSITYLGIIVDGDQLKPDPKKTSALKDWPRTLHTVKEVRSILGVLGYQRPFIPNFANIARPLVALTKKDHPFLWTTECKKALDSLIATILNNPALHQPDLSRPFFLQVDASAFATGAILTQKDDRGKHVTVGFHSQTFNEAERNYDIHDREFLAVFRGLTHHRHLLLSSPFPTTVFTDHKNLEYYRHPRHINRRVARYIPQLADYDFILVHFPGTANKSDALSRRPDYPQGSEDNDNITVLPPHLFARAATFSSVDDRTRACQLRQPDLLKKWATTFPLKVINDLYWYGDRLVVVDDLPLRRGVISLYHDSPTAGHPGISNTAWAIARDYWWPNLKQTITEYIKGCHVCQSRKNNPSKPKPPLFPITSDNFTLPFTSVAMDFIVKLPMSEGYDSVLTITDTFSKACIFLPCNETIDAAGVALLYATYVLPHYGLPSRIISDRDPRFMATIIQELCRILSIQHNASTAYRPQTDGQSERSNQKLEQYFRIFTNFHQTNWRHLLPLAQFTFNAWPNATTKKAPFELIMGHIPRVHQVFRTTTSPPLNDRLALITQARKDAAEALHRSQAIELPSSFIPYNKGDLVWLEGKNLNTTHPSAKLAPRRFGPFLVTDAISRTSFRIKLPPSWKIHNVFHGTLLMPYKETTLNGNKYQEPAPDLVDGQPEWEVEQILGARKRRHQLQYLVRWKGFSEAHDSWEPLTNLHADSLIRDYYRTHPSAIRTTYKTTQGPGPNPITIRRITVMSEPLSPLPLLTPSPPSSPRTETLTYPLSPPGLPVRSPVTPLQVPNPELTTSPMVPPSTLPSPTLLSRIRDPPPPLSLYHRISPPTEPLSLEETIEICEAMLGDGPRAVFHDPPPTPSPPGQRAPTSYVRYEPGDPNHDKYVEQIALDPPYGTPQDPHYVCFDLDFESHQHYVLGLRDDSDPPRQAYGWPLQAAPFIGPKISPARSDNSALGIFDAGYPGAIEVDIALYELRDYGVLADVDRYRPHVGVREPLVPAQGLGRQVLQMA